MSIRLFRPGDEAAIADIFFSAVREIASLDYSAEQVKAWAPDPPAPEQFAKRAADGRTVFVATDQADRPLAYADLEADGHIDHIYCCADHVGRGMAKALYDRLEREARSRGIGRLYVEASEPARRFFLKRGFAELERNDFTLNGVPIHNYRMQKQLS